MTLRRFNVIIIGAGPAGVTAAGALAGTGLSVALLEAGVYAGAENWSGCVYFTESLAAPDCFGTAAVAAAPFERRVVRRGTLMHNGLDVIGLELSDEKSFRNCYTVLRPVFDPYFANLARTKGIVHLTGTTVTALIRKSGRVVGVQTNHGPLSADVTFIAEGDASHLVRAEQLERVAEPHFLQGVKAVLSLDPAQIEERFRLGAGEAAAYEMLLRDPALGGRTAHLNIGAFLYTNRDSLSLGYVAPLDHVRDNFRGSHDRVYEWISGLPYIRDLIRGTTLSAYGTKLIRSGGLHDQPVLVENGLAVGGAAAGFGVDFPFPNFTGPASATGLFFARAVRTIAKRGGSFDAAELLQEYAAPLGESVYGANARALSRWPGYFGRSQVLFGRTVDLACGTAHFLAGSGIAETGRFLRKHVLSLRALREIGADSFQALSALRLRGPLLKALTSPRTFSHWTANLVRRTPPPGQKLGYILRINGRDLHPNSFPWPVKGLLERILPRLEQALDLVYANDGRPLDRKFVRAVEQVVQGLSLTDLVILPLYGMTLLLAAVATAAADAFRYYVLKAPAATMLAGPAMAYAEEQRKARDLDLLRPASSLEAKLATNTYRVGREPHITTSWPEQIRDHPAMAQAGLWWVCPARVYGYEAPPFAGRGKVTVNYENCIKCESCWRAEPLRTLWGRHTDHRLIYRPESAALADLLRSLREAVPPRPCSDAGKQVRGDEHKLKIDAPLQQAAGAVLHASQAFRESVGRLPASADKTRTARALALGSRLIGKMNRLEAVCADLLREQTDVIRSEREALEQRLSEGRIVHALYCSDRIETRIKELASSSVLQTAARTGIGPAPSLSPAALSALFPDRTVKEWEESPMPEAWCGKLRGFILEHREMPQEAVRSLASISPALGLIAARQFLALPWEGGADAGVCAMDGARLDVRETAQGTTISGMLPLVPLAAGSALLILAKSKAYRIPLSAPGLSVNPTPAIGFRAAGLTTIRLDCMVTAEAAQAGDGVGRTEASLYLALALGAADYLSRRVKEHGLGRVQFGGQMLDTEGRDGIAKLGAVKALIARVEAWRMLLQCLYDGAVSRELRTLNSELPLLLSTLAAKAFGPEPGSMGYDAGQVFGGFAYSEDDLLSRYYRDSSLFRFLAPGHGAAARLDHALPARELVTMLQPSLGMIEHAPLGAIGGRFKNVLQECAALSPETDAVLSGEAKALLIGTHALLLASEELLENGSSAETEAAACEVLLSLTEDALAKAKISSGRGTVPPDAHFPMEPHPACSGRTDYEAFCTAPGDQHRSGTFLVTSFDRSPRFVPEMQLGDPKLVARWRDLVDWFRTNCREKRFEGLQIERFIEANHRLPQEIVRAVREHKWLATYIPKELDGLGWRKAEYYILNAAAGSFGDASIDLLIMASTSIGTTPMLLGLQDELPRVQEELGPLAEDEQMLGLIGARLERLINTFDSPNPAWIKKEYEAILRLVDQRMRRTRVVKYLAANFLKAFYGAGMAGRRGDAAGFMQNLKDARELFSGLMPDVRAALQELPRRERCHRFFLRSLGHGGVSAFALTEPTAGSDTGGVKTTARLRRVRLSTLDDGRYSFSPDGSEEERLRYLIDADKIVFTEFGMAYVTPDGSSQPIRYDRYDYSADQGQRSYIYNGRECPFHDIGQIRETPTGPVYEFYSVTGAKMWITNGSIATQFCLYAQTPEGVTGLLVDRHAEGLTVGADEKKTGQRGSPTNEISLDSVRVPREAVIGYEGHGQVNALETLNVGRCGLAVVSGALMRKLLEEAGGSLPPSPERDRLLGEAAAILFSSESLAYYLVGLFDRPHESVRMESAIAKYACSEDIHEFITLLEQAFGPQGQTEQFLLEKARRDSRILTIYEGTNEVQRFLILKDLIARAADWPVIAPRSTAEADSELAFWKNRLRDLTVTVRELLGDASWSDAMLQPALFPLSEMAGEILRLECLWYRMEWLNANGLDLDHQPPGYSARMLAAGRRGMERTTARLAQLFERSREGLEQIRSNGATPEVRLADAALDAFTRKGLVHGQPPGSLRAQLRVLCIVRPVADLSPHPRIREGQLQELVWTIDPADRAGLAQMLELKANSAAPVIVDVLMPGGAEHEHLLRAAVGIGADNLHRVPIAPEASFREYIPCIQDLEVMQHYQIIITGAACRSGDEGLAAYIGGRLKRYHYRREDLEVKPDGSGIVHLALPAVVSITGTAAEPFLPITGLVAAQDLPVRVLRAPAPSETPLFQVPSAPAPQSPPAATPAQAADLLTAFAVSASGGREEDFSDMLGTGPIPRGDAVWTVLEPADRKQNMALLRASARTARLAGKKLHAVVCGPKSHWPRLLGLARAHGCSAAWCLDTVEGRLSKDGRRSLLRLLLATSENTLVMAPLDWTSSAAYVAGEAEAHEKFLFCSGATNAGGRDGARFFFSRPCYDGRLARTYPFTGGRALVTITPEAEFPAAAAEKEFSAQVLDITINPDWTMPLPPLAPPTLAQADVIIDLGYGVRDGSGLKLAEALKERLEALGLAPLFGATRKVTQDLKLLPLETQIGQTGVRVNPKLIIALGISGAPQHVDYLGSRAEILCFNKDSEAPLMKLNQSRPWPRVHPVPGDLFVTVRQLMEKLEP